VQIALVILGGVALILYGVRILRKGLDRVLGGRLWPFLTWASKRPERAIVTGVGMSLLAPSSTSVSVLAAQAVRGGHVTVARMLLIMLGADIGLTMMVQLLSFRVEDTAPALALLGVLLYQYSKNNRAQGIGQILLSFAFVFMGIGLIQQGASRIDSAGDFADMLTIAGRHPFWMALLAALLAVVLQSSTATVGLVLGLAASAEGHQLLSSQLAVSTVIGANVGTALTLMLVGRDHPDTRRLGLSNLLIKLFVAVLCLIFLTDLIRLLTFAGASLPRQVADSHTGYNVLKAIVAMPLVGVFILVADRLLPQSKRAKLDGAEPIYLDTASPIEDSNLALSQSMREILRVGDIVRGMSADMWRALREDDEELARQVSSRDNTVDRLEGEIKRFLSRLATHKLDVDQATERLRQLTYLSELEAIGDLIDKNLCELVLKKIRRRVNFSTEAWAELEQIDRHVFENMQLADAAFHTRDRHLCNKLLRHKDFIDIRVRELRDRHLASLGGTDEQDLTQDATAVHLDILTNLRRVNSHVTHVAFMLLQGPTPNVVV